MRCNLALFACGILACLTNAGAVDLLPYAKPDAPLLKTVLEKRLKFWRTQTVESYKARGIAGAWDADVIRLLEDLAAIEAGATQPVPLIEAKALAKKLIEVDRCPDPIVAWAAFRLEIAGDGDWKQRNRLNDRATKSWSEDHPAPDKQGPTKPWRHPAILLMEAKAFCLSTWSRPKNEAEKAKVMPIVADLQAALEGAILDEAALAAPAVLISKVRDIKVHAEAYGEPLVATVEAALPKSRLPAWAADGVRAAIRISNAWAWRGSGWANTVTPEGWKGFEANLKEADLRLVAAWTANPKESYFAAMGGTLAGAGNSSVDADTWFLRGVQACFDDLKPYHSRLNFLRPRWGGGYREMIAFGTDCLATARFDTEVPWFQIATIHDAISDAVDSKALGTLRPVLAAAAVQQAVDTCLAGYLAIHPDKSNRYACLKAAIRWHAGLKVEAKTILGAVPEASRDAAVAKQYHVTYADILGSEPAKSDVSNF